MTVVLICNRGMINILSYLYYKNCPSIYNNYTFKINPSTKFNVIQFKLFNSNYILKLFNTKEKVVGLVLTFYLMSKQIEKINNKIRFLIIAQRPISCCNPICLHDNPSYILNQCSFIL